MEIYVPRFKNVEERIYTLEVITPMFLGGADKKVAEFRIPSLKGVLRFWWRALYGKKFDSLAKMKEHEDLIFGSTDIKSSFSVEVVDSKINKEINLPKGEEYPVYINNVRRKVKLGILHYLSFGLYDYDKNKKENVFKRKHIKHGSKINIKLRYYSNYIEQIENSLFALINYGGLGARSRNGFGSLYCKNSHFDIKKFFNGKLKDYTATSDKSRLFTINIPFNKWEEALSKLGLIYLNARLKLEKKHEYYKRGLVARPIKSKREQIPTNIANGRHPKSYFLHINKIEDKKYTGSILFLPYNFYEKDKIDEYLKIYDEMNIYINNGIKEVKNEYNRYKK